MPFVYRKEPTAREGNPLQAPQSFPALSQDQQSQYPERILKKLETARKFGCAYIPTDDDIKEIEFEKYKQVFKDSLVHNVTFLRRIKEFPSGNEWLVYRCQDTITDDEGQPKTHNYYEGFTTEAVPNIKRNALREIIDVTMERERIIYTIPFSKEAVDEALAIAKNVPSDYAVAYNSEFGPDPWRGNELTIWNLNDFTTYPFDILEEANRLGYSNKAGTGIPDMFKYQKEDSEQMQDSIKTMNVQKAKRDIQKAESYQQAQNAKKG